MNIYAINVYSIVKCYIMKCYICFHTVAAPGVLLNVAVLCSGYYWLLEVCVCTAASSGMFFDSGGCHVLSGYFLVLTLKN